MPLVLQLLRDSKLSELCYAYKIRTKPEVKLLEKVTRKVPDKPGYSLADITDVVGLRLVALFRAEMVDIFEGVLSAITHANGVNPNPFSKGCPEQVIIYKGTNLFDDLPARLRVIADRLSPSLHISEEHSREGYSSVHIVTRLSIVPKSLPRDGYTVPIEIQIRSVFEDAWGEIDHKYKYVIRTGKDAGKPIGNPEFVHAHLKVLKQLADGCMQYADVIRTEAEGVPPGLLAARKVLSVASDSYILDRFKELGISAELIDKYRAARDIKDEAGKLMDSDSEAGRLRYVEAAERFSDLAHAVESGLTEAKMSSGESLLFYYLRMNEAVSLMSTNERDQVMAALGIYQTLETPYSEFPLLRMRIGQALGKLGYVDQALEKLREAGKAADKIATTLGNAEAKQWPDSLPYTDFDHIRRTQPKLVGYHIWLMIRGLPPNESARKRQLFGEAYEVTIRGLEAVKHSHEQELSLHNNLLYYGLGQLTRTAAGSPEEAKLKEQVVKHVNCIEGNGPARSKLTISAADTLMKAYSILGRKDDATAIASILIDKCLGNEAINLDPTETLELLRLAHQVREIGQVGVID